MSIRRGGAKMSPLDVMRPTMSGLARVVTAVLALHIIGAGAACPASNCVCSGTVALEMQCSVDERNIKINLLPKTYIIISCANAPILDYSKLPNLRANSIATIKSITFKDCPLPSTSFQDVLERLGVTKTMSLIFQNGKNLSAFFERKHFKGLTDLTKLLLSVNGATHLPDNLFMDMRSLTWLNIRSNGISLSEKLFRPLERLETLEISHNDMTNISSSLFSHLSFLRKLSLWQSNVTKFSNDLFSGVDVLEELDFSSNGLNELPPSIFKPLTKLKKLTLFSNKFSSLPPELFRSNEGLDTVIIFNNNVKLRSLPVGLFRAMPNLKEIYIQRCGLEEVPSSAFSNSSQITNISLAYNELQTLPEAVFNDQINLLELDLSHNKIKKLEPKLFSSLVKLEKLNLCYNSLETISGSTFSSLLSLIYLNMEHNNLKIISSFLFRNNKQRMSINMAYNELKFEAKILVNNTHVLTKISPFAKTYNLKLLNLSHNEFENTFDDWWHNGHENLDISYNKIQILLSPEVGIHSIEETLSKSPQKLIKRVWLDHNPLNCACDNANFLAELRKRHTMGASIEQFNCSITEIGSLICDDMVVPMILVFPFVVTLSVIAIIFTVRQRRHVYSAIKMKLQNVRDKQQMKKWNDIVVTYSEKDEQFVLQEIIPVLTVTKNLLVQTKPINDKTKFTHLRKDMKESLFAIVVFSPNYLTSVYYDTHIRKILGEMLKTKNAVFVFVDIGPDNSIYSFLKQQRDASSSLLWNEPYFWDIILDMFNESCKIKKQVHAKESNKLLKKIVEIFKLRTRHGLGQGPFVRRADGHSLSALDTLAHSQV